MRLNPIRFNMNAIRTTLLGSILCSTLLWHPASATQYHWTGGTDTDWFNGNNWSKGTDADPWPRSGDTPRLGINASFTPTLWPHYNGDNSASPTTGAFLIASVREAWFYMESGTNRHDSWVNLGNGGGFTGHWIQAGGTFNNSGRQFSVGESSIGDFQMSAGWLVTGDFRLSTTATGAGTGLISGTGWVEAGQAQIGMFNTGTLTLQDAGRLQLGGSLYLGNAANSAVGTLNLLGGKVYADTLVFNTAASRIRLDGGMLELGGDESANASSWLSDGYLYTTLPGAAINWAYDSANDRTTFIAAVPEPGGLGLALGGGLALLAFRRSKWARHDIQDTPESKFNQPFKP